MNEQGAQMLTQAELQSQLHYNHETGIFTRLIVHSNRLKVGDIAGSKQRTGYLLIGINKKRYLSHRLAWLYVHGEFPLKDTDHINGVRDDNRIVNLREATRSENNFNVGVRKNNTSGFKGVCFNKEMNKWRANAGLNGKKLHLGLFSTPELASQAYQAFAKVVHGDFKHDIEQLKKVAKNG